jgi:hypothetical protein
VAEVISASMARIGTPPKVMSKSHRTGRGVQASTSAVRTERTAHLVPLGPVSARQGCFEPVSGFEPLTVRLQGQPC